ncbi:hypothetical protein [Viridibacillus arvi]|uniref:hypothetical protein n=1 Tax=Viridibacillus arvi TaxID=263475 RepID=UPI003D081268
MPKKIWNKELLKLELQKIFIEENKEQPIKLYKDYPQVYRACLKQFGSIENALVEANIYDEIAGSRKWTSEEIKKALFLLLEKEMRGEKFDFSKNYQSLKSACRRNYGTVENAAKSFGLENKLKFIRGKNQYKWADNPQKVLDVLKDLYQKNKKGFPDFYIKHKAVVRACENHYGSAKAALEKAEIPTIWIKKPRCSMTRDELIFELKQMFKVDNLTLTQARKQCPLVFQSIKSHFKDLRDALDKSEIIYSDILIKNERNAGRLAEEKIVEAIFTELGVAFSKGFSNKIRPDFVLKNYWADAKLNYYDKNGWERTIKKYTKFTKQLVIIYIFGPDMGIHRIRENTLATHINYYIKQLPNNRQIYYREQIEKIRQFVLNQGEVFEDLLSNHSNIVLDKTIGKVTYRRGNFSFSIQSETWQQSLVKLLEIPLNYFSK